MFQFMFSEIPKLLLALKEAEELMEQSGHSHEKVTFKK